MSQQWSTHRKNRKRDVLIVVCLVIFLILGLLGYASYSAYYGPVPETSGAMAISGLQDNVTVYRDEWGIPQIYANSVEDLFFAQGYTHAQDRWWQMEVTRRMGRGELSQITGENDEIQRFDLIVITLGWQEQAERQWQRIDPATRRIVNAYTAGINAYISERGSEELAMEYSLLALSGEVGNLFALLGQDVTVQEWGAVDSLLWGQIFNWQLSGNIWQEISQIPDGHPLLSDLSIDLFKLVGLETNLQGTGIVVHGSETTTGKSILVNDLQGSPAIPSQWFEMGLHCRELSLECSFDVSGFSVPGMPGILVGHNDRIAWGISSLNADTQDLYRLRLNPNNPTQYQWEGKWRDMTQRIAVIKINEETSYAYPVYLTHLGPVLTDLEATADNLRTAFVLKTVSSEENWLSHTLKLNSAQNWREFREILSTWPEPALQFFYADVNGNIGYQVAGTFPLRTAAHNANQPAPGWTSESEWQGTVPFEVLPSRRNPPGKLIFRAGDSLGGYGDYLQEVIARLGSDLQISLSASDSQSYRNERLEYLLETRDEYSLDSLARVQADVYNSLAAEVLPYIFETDFEDADLIDAIQWLGQWSLENTADSPQAAWFEVFWAEVMRETNSSPDDLLALLDDPGNVIWDDEETPFTDETRDDVLRQALIRSYNVLLVNLDEDRERWQWGDLHRVHFVSRVIGNDGVLPLSDVTSTPINRGFHSLDGCSVCLNATRYDFDSEGDGSVSVIASYRIIMDLSDFENSRAMYAIGQSGHPASENYDDMIVPWLTVDYHNMTWGQAIIVEPDKQLDLRPGPTLTPTPLEKAHP
ncbi:MAG: penicillin acylase family protein [Chloroflexi bacterium]|nr:penicillin acylase family protein [Chloroflexota bacterium]